MMVSVVFGQLSRRGRRERKGKKKKKRRKPKEPLVTAAHRKTPSQRSELKMDFSSFFLLDLLPKRRESKKEREKERKKEGKKEKVSTTTILTC